MRPKIQVFWYAKLGTGKDFPFVQSNLKTEAASTTETLVASSKYAWRHIQEDLNLKNCCEDLKSRTALAHRNLFPCMNEDRT